MHWSIWPQIVRLNPIILSDKMTLTQLNGKRIFVIRKGDVMREIPKCPTSLLGVLDEKIRELAEAWATSETRPRIDKTVAEYWDSLIEDWVGDVAWLPSSVLLLLGHEPLLRRTFSLPHFLVSFLLLSA